MSRNNVQARGSIVVIVVMFTLAGVLLAGGLAQGALLGKGCTAQSATTTALCEYITKTGVYRAVAATTSSPVAVGHVWVLDYANHTCIAKFGTTGIYNKVCHSPPGTRIHAEVAYGFVTVRDVSP